MRFSIDNLYCCHENSEISISFSSSSISFLIFFGQTSKISYSSFKTVGSFVISFSINGAYSSKMTLISLTISFLTFFLILSTIFSSIFSICSCSSSTLVLISSLKTIKRYEIRKNRFIPSPVTESNESYTYENKVNYIARIIEFKIIPSITISHYISLTTNFKILGCFD